MIYWIWLSELKGYGLAEKRRLIAGHGSPKAVYDALSEKLEKPFLCLDGAKRIWDDCIKKQVYITPYKDYGIMDQNDLPLILYCRGEFRTGMRSVGIVGSRRCSEYGKSITGTIAKQLAARGVAIVSGMAKGIDSYAHGAALEVGGYTVAVLGCGIDICYPAEHRLLYESIIENGLVISEYSPGHPAGNETFPRRNRIIAAFSDYVLVTEAGRISGALLTAEDSLLYGKRLYACPGPIDSKTSEGCNRLIAEGKARLYMPGDLLEDENEQLTLPGIFPDSVFSFAKETKKVNKTKTTVKKGQTKEKKTGNDEVRTIMDHLKQTGGSSTIPAVSDVIGKDGSAVYGIITDMEMNDLIFVEGDRIWLRK